MSKEPDWETLSSFNFVVNRRMSEHLNAALAAISLIETGDGDQPPEFWLERAVSEVLRSLNLHSAWASLVRHKLGEHFLPQHMLQFRASELMRWLATELQLSHFDPLADDIILYGNRETLQEALLLLHSCANALGPHVRVQAEADGSGMWFRVRYDIAKNAPHTLEKLVSMLESRPDSWRAQNAIFELKRARDFLSMNNCELHYSVNQGFCELAFFVNSTGKIIPPTELTAQRASTTVVSSSRDATDTVVAGDS